MRLIITAITAALLFAACQGPLEQAQKETSAAPSSPALIAPQPYPMPDPAAPTPLPPVDDELPGGYGWPTWGDCSDSTAC